MCIRDSAVALGVPAVHCADKKDAAALLISYCEPDDVVLVKASHGMAFETILDDLYAALDVRKDGSCLLYTSCPHDAEQDPDCGTDTAHGGRAAPRFDAFHVESLLLALLYHIFLLKSSIKKRRSRCFAAFAIWSG